MTRWEARLQDLRAVHGVQLVVVGCLHLLALTDPECLLAFLLSSRAQSLLREASERPSPSDDLDGSLKVLISSREVQHIYVQRWSGRRTGRRLRQH